MAGATLLSGCKTIEGTLRPAQPVAADSFRAGAAVADITPIPGFAMGGHSIAGAVARGFWTRLRARVICLQDSQGHSLVLAACDLWSMPAGLADRVIELVQAEPVGHGLGKEQLVLAATHTHQSPGNFSSSEIYNLLASREPGFDPALFEFLARRIANAVLEAMRVAEPAEVFLAETTVTNVARNRSFPAFVRDPESECILKDNAWIPLGPRSAEYPASEAWRAVDPRLRVLRVEKTTGQREVLAVAAFFAVHATAMPHELEFYSSDLFGVATMLAERDLRRLSVAAHTPIVALFNGAEGDVSPGWRVQGRQETLRLGNLLGQRISDLGMAVSTGARVDGPIEIRFTNAPLAAFCVRDGHGDYHTARLPALGASALCGAEDGRTAAATNGYVEGMVGPSRGDQGSKLSAFDVHYLGLPSTISIDRLISALAEKAVPRTVPVGLYRIGRAAGIVLGTLPGEFTTVMGQRIADTVGGRMGLTRDRVLLVGLANEYLSYFATPEEYAAQNYEGASTLYGPQAGPAVQQYLGGLAAAFSTPATVAHEQKFRYLPGMVRHFGTDSLKHSPSWAADSAVEFFLQGQVARRFEWCDIAPGFGRTSSCAVVPRVSIEQQMASGGWEPLRLADVIESNEGLNFLTLVKRPTDRNHVMWQAAWIPPGGIDFGITLRFRVDTLGGEKLGSPPFHLGP